MFAASKSGKATAVVPATPDPSFPSVTLLTETTGTNGQTNNSFLDSSSNNFSITRVGSATQGSVNPYWPNSYWSNYFNGSTDYLSNASNSVLTFGSADFTVEYWAFCPSLNSPFSVVFGGDTSSATDIAFGFNPSSPYCTHSANWPVYTTTPMPIGVWTHLAFTRTSGTWKVYINGVDVTTGSQSNPSVTTTTLGIGARSSGANKFIGYISNIRVIKGQALNSTGNFTPSTTPVTATAVGWTGANVAGSITGTVSLLTCRSNRFIDNSPSPTIFTTTGSPSSQVFQPVPPPASYTAGAYGGSGYFNGTTDYLSLADNVALQLGSGDFTIEGWFIISGPTSTAYNLISKGTAVTGWSLNTTTTARVQFSYTALNLTGATTLITPNVWYHIAVVRSGTSTGNLKIYINGAQEVASTGAVLDNFNQTDLLYISASRTATLPLNGFSSNVRVVKGIAVYTGAFSPPTLAPLTTAGSTSAASYSSTTNVNTSFAASATSLLSNFTNAGVYDATMLGDQITAGSAQTSITQYKWSPTSINFNGTTDYITSSDSSGILTSLAGIPLWTVECWFYNTNTTASSTFVFCKGGRRDTSVSPSYGLSVIGSTGSGVFVIGNNTVSFGSAYSFTYPSSTFATNAWVYFAAVSSSSGIITTYVNGVLKSTSGSGISVILCANESFSIGSAIIAPANAFTGYIQDFRITKGVARTITASPTSAFPTR